MNKENIKKQIEIIIENKQECETEFEMAELIGKLGIIIYYDPKSYATALAPIVETYLEKLGFKNCDVLKNNVIGEILTNEKYKENEYHDAILNGCYSILDKFYNNDNESRATATVTIAMHYNNFKNGVISESLHSLWDL